MTRRAAVEWAVAALNGGADRRLEARRLLGLAASLSPEAIIGHGDVALDDAAWARLGDLVARRRRGEPVSRLAGEREFWSLPLRITPATLDPRPDSETLVELALERLAPRERAWRLVDLGTGSGALLLALLSELPAAFGVGIDISAAACAVARDNARALGLGRRAAFAAANWTSAMAGPVDLVVANPPYIPHHEIDRLAPEVRHFDPRRALDGGSDGLDAYRVIAPALPGLLRPGGWAVLEVGESQAAAVLALLAAAGLRSGGAHPDLAGRIRAVTANR
ncbi:MAG: peptide chain release factor N(5)-glutamine methyltransferase [Alphaproteobacteria bacterium]|nr:peptide chain release factor N(5)-glutamine methyltransferase [Alphaproteobacteria bacterium]